MSPAIATTRERLRLLVTPSRYGATLRRRYRMLSLRGRDVECPCCGSRFREFMPDWNRPNAICPRCGAQERHRALWLYLEERTDLFERPQSLLHFAPEYVFQSRLQRLPHLDYLSADLESPDAMVHFDITAIPYPDSAFDSIICSHVLEHVRDDSAAMRELVRVLRPGGWAIVLVPLDLSREETYEDASIATPEEREREYWQHDHLRLYGRDFSRRLEQGGFRVRVDRFVRELGPERIARHGLLEVDDIYLCTKPG